MRILWFVRFEFVAITGEMTFQQIGVDDWSAVSANAWSLTRSWTSPEPPLEFISLIMTEFPIRIAPLVAQWFNELDLIEYAKRIENNFQDSWFRIPGSLSTSPDLFLVPSREAAQAPSEFTPHESYVCLSSISSARCTDKS